MKTKVLALFITVCMCACAQADNLTDLMKIVRATYQTDREVLVGDALQLTQAESAAFWPLYESYKKDVEKLGDSLIKLVLEYADAYPNVPEKRAREMLKEYTSLEQNLVAKRASYLKRAAKILPATKALRWAQVENRLDLVLRLRLADGIPLVPSESKR